MADELGRKYQGDDDEDQWGLEVNKSIKLDQGN